MRKPAAVPQLETERLRLRGLELSDAPALFEVFSNAEVARYLSHPAFRSVDEAAAMVTRNLGFAAEGSGYTWALALKSNDRAIGTGGLFAFNEQCDRAEIGYILGRAHWGRGLMHEALTALIDHAFGAMELRRLEADVDPRNAASLRSLERLGFQREGLLRERWVVAGEISDTAFLGLLRHEWIARREGDELGR
jgi:RimJ/RimL family protein N-acetyltransferase